MFICDECVEVCNDIIADDRRLLELLETTKVQDGSQTDVFPNVPVSGPAVQCTLCRLPITRGDGVVIHNRGILCVGCVGEVEAAAAERRESRS